MNIIQWLDDRITRHQYVLDHPSEDLCPELREKRQLHVKRMTKKLEALLNER
jgi:hypothetical protein